MAPGNTLPPEVTFITPEHLKARLDAGEYLCLIDERESDEFGIAHIPGARVTTRSRVVAEGNDDAQAIDCTALSETLSRTWVTRTLAVATTMAESGHIATLQRLGYRHIFVIQGGFLAWSAAGFPVETGFIDAMT